MPVEEIFVFAQVVIVTHFQEALVSVAIPQLSQACPGQSVQRSPQHFVVEAPHVDFDSAGASFAPDNVNWFWWKGKCRP